MINRSVLTIKAKEPFVEWLKSLPDPADNTLEEINLDSTAYLLPDYESDDKQTEIIEQFFDIIFEEQLNGWWTDERDWPVHRNIDTFNKWIDVELHSVVLDLVDMPLEDVE